MKYEKKLVLFTLFVMNLVDEPAPEVTIEQGILTGITSNDGSYFEYLGIPYASLNARFKAPQPPPSWSGVFKATRTYTCPQPTPFGFGATEDCLIINVYVPAKPKTVKPLPVMLYIHGGAFFLGTGGKIMHAPNFLIPHDVIVATFTYRLGPLGFTCLDIPEAPGNAGLKDQLAALRWVKKNIAAFGGDPDNITLFGESAGASSAAFLVASNVTDGLFHKAIMISGSSTGFWSLNREPIYTASLVAKKLGYNTSNPKEIYDIFSKVPYNELVSVLYLGRKLRNKYYETDLLHLPCIEKYFPGEERIIPELPYNAITRNPRNIPLMYGATSHEGLYLISVLKEETIKINDDKYLFSSDLEMPTEDEENKVNTEIRNHYFGTKKMSKDTIMNISAHLGDLYFVIPMLLETEIMLKNSNAPIYNYWFDYIGGRNFVKHCVTGYGNAHGASHGDTNLYLFYALKWPFPINKRDRKMIDTMTKMWTNFAKYGNPTPEPNDLPFKWNPSTKDNLNFLYVNDESKMGPIPDMKSYKLWKSIYEKYRRKKIDRA